MKVILLQHVKGKGKKGDIIEVSDGYAQNALLPRKLAKVATATELNKIKLASASEEKKEADKKERTLQLLKTIDGKTVTINEKLTPKGTLYHALGLKEIIKAVYSELKLSTPNDLYKEKYALKEAGDYKLELAGYGTSATLHLTITGK